MITEDKKRECVKRLILARMRLLSTNGFFGLLLMHAQFALDFTIETAATDGAKIYFSPKFMDNLSDKELDFVLMHEIMHIAFGHCLRGKNKDPHLFNIACDVVINSNILQANGWDKSTISLRVWGESMHLTPDGEEGCEFTAEQVYEKLINKVNNKIRKKPNSSANSQNTSKKNKNGNGENWDNHEKWKDKEGDLTQEEMDNKAIWDKIIKDACEAIKIRKQNTGVGNLPLLAERKLKELTEPQMNWREILANFVQEEVSDYSFSPPDKRYYDGPFFMPDYNETDISVKNVLFMIDTSGSMSDEMITQAYSEIKGAIDQFNGKLQGLLGFFEATVIAPVPFYDEESFMVIKPKGGGGTSFECVFKYVKSQMADNLPASIVILTDGYASFPPEESALGIPVLWVINNDLVSPPWGKVARIKD